MKPAILPFLFLASYLFNKWCLEDTDLIEWPEA